MEIKKARELLGKKYEYLSDEEVDKIVMQLKFFASSLVENVLKNNENNECDHFS